MTAKNCPKGKTWDHLLRTCVEMSATQTRKLQAPTEPVLDPLTIKASSAKSTGPPHALLPAQILWVCVILVTMGAILALAIWFVVFRRQNKARKSHGVAEDSVQEVLKKTEPAVEFHSPSERNLQGAADGSCRPTRQPNPKCEDDFSVCRERGVNDHRVPLPATELGGTVLVTAKTV